MLEPWLNPTEAKGIKGVIGIMTTYLPPIANIKQSTSTLMLDVDVSMPRGVPFGSSKDVVNPPIVTATSSSKATAVICVASIGVDAVTGILKCSLMVNHGCVCP